MSAEGSCEPGKPVRRLVLMVKASIKEGYPSAYSAMLRTFERYFEVREYAGEADGDAAVSVGGDGTFLALARALPEGVPILGINMGKRGAVTDALPDDMPIIVERLREGAYCIEKRMKLEISTPEGSMDVINEAYAARRLEGPTPFYTVKYNGREVYSARMDGIIISTPTGSTGYSLSAGGPVLHELMEAAVVTPVMPISKVPPLVVPLGELEVESTSPLVVLLDGQVKLESAGPLRARRSSSPLRLIRVSDRPFQHLRKTLCQ